jgi:transcriptional regulator with XRE-family HTH domain
MLSILVRFGKRVRSLRRAQNLTQEQLARAADLSTRTIQKIEAGQMNILLTTVDRIQTALGCKGGDLFDDSPIMIMEDSPRRPKGNQSSAPGASDPRHR